jgi:hypothetical protein
MEIELLPCTVLYVLYVNTFLLLVVLIAGPTRPFETRTPDALRAAYGIKDVSTVIGACHPPGERGSREANRRLEALSTTIQEDTNRACYC